MSRRTTAICGVFMGTAALVAGAAAQQPRLVNGRVTAQPAGSLQQTFRALVSAQTDAAWIGYAVPVHDRNRVMCCWTGTNGTTFISGSMAWTDAPCCGSCRIEPAQSGSSGDRATQTGTAPAGPVKLEGPENMIVLFRVVDRQVERIRTYSEDCELDAGGRPVHWLQDVRPADSVQLLESLVTAESERKSRITNAALSAISMHREPSAAATIERLARSHTTPAVRGEAIFWLAQMAGSKVAGAITTAIENDPDTEVKKRAVFALSQLPKDEGVPLLINVARTNPNPAVKKQAIFWLGQSKDPRALDFFAQILK